MTLCFALADNSMCQLTELSECLVENKKTMACGDNQLDWFFVISFSNAAIWWPWLHFPLRNSSFSLFLFLLDPISRVPAPAGKRGSMIQSICLVFLLPRKHEWRCKMGLCIRLQLWHCDGSSRSHLMRPQTVQIDSSQLRGCPVRGVLQEPD